MINTEKKNRVWSLCLHITKFNQNLNAKCKRLLKIVPTCKEAEIIFGRTFLEGKQSGECKQTCPVEYVE